MGGAIMIKLGREEPAMSMDAGGKIIWAKHSELQQASLKAIEKEEIADGERLPLAVKDMGSCEVYPQTLSHNPNGRFVVVCGDGEYIIYTAMALRNKSFGSAQEFVWAADSSEYAVRESSSSIKLFKNFKEKKTFKPEFGAENIFGGGLLGVKSVSGLAFFDWETQELVRRIEIQPRNVYWSENGELCCIATEESYFVLRYDAEKVAAAAENPEKVSEDGIEDAFDVIGEVTESVKTGLWVGDCFIYTNSVNRLNYYVGGEIVTVSHLDRTMYLLGYIPGDNRLYLGDKELNVVSFQLLLSVLEYQTAVMRRDFDTADKVLPTVPKEQRTRVAHFLEKQGFKAQALHVSSDPEHRFELAIQLGDLKVAYDLASEAASEQKWKQLAELATKQAKFELAQQCLHEAQDHGGLLLLATAAGNAEMVGKLGSSAEEAGKNNVSFLSYFLLGDLEKCLDVLIESGRLPEAAFFARTYLPSQISRVLPQWKEQLTKVSEKAGQSLADPNEYKNLFSNFNQTLEAEQMLAKERKRRMPASMYKQVPENAARCPLEELDENHDDIGEDLSEGEEEKFSSPVTETSQAPPVAQEPPVVKEVKPPVIQEIPKQKSPTPPDLSEDEDEKFSSPAPEASPAPPAPAEQEVPKKKVPTSPEPTKKLSTPPSSEPEVSGDDLEAELEKDLGDLDLGDVDTDDVDLDDDDLLED